MSQLPQKLKLCRLELQLTQEEAALESGFAQRDISRFEKGRAKTIPNEYMQWLHKKGVDLNLLFDDSVDASPNASLFASPNQEIKMNPVEKGMHLKAAPTPVEIIVATQDTAGNPTYTAINHRAAANYLSGYESQEYYESLGVATLPRALVGSPRQGILLQVEGDSMTPKFQHGDWVACTLLDRSEWPQARDFDCYVVVSTTYGIQFKRIKNTLTKYGFLRCKSDNRRHRAYNIEEENLLQLFRFVLHISPDASNPEDALYQKVDHLEDTTTDLRILVEQLQDRLEAQIKPPNPPKDPEKAP